MECTLCGVELSSPWAELERGSERNPLTTPDRCVLFTIPKCKFIYLKRRVWEALSQGQWATLAETGQKPTDITSQADMLHLSFALSISYLKFIMFSQQNSQLLAYSCIFFECPSWHDAEGHSGI